MWLETFTNSLYSYLIVSDSAIEDHSNDEVKTVVYSYTISVCCILAVKKYAYVPLEEILY